MRKLTTVIAVAGATTAMALALAAVPKVAQAGDIGCGDILVADTLLHEDLNCITTSGLIIGADGVTVDLSGFTITGDPEWPRGYSLTRRLPLPQECRAH